MTSKSDAVIELGKCLAGALDTSDIIGRWMAHHLADLITRAEAQPADQELARETREVILKLWEHKAGSRFTNTPFEFVKPVLAALARLEPDPQPWAHFRVLSAEELPPDNDLAHYPVLDAATDMDREFGHLVRLAVTLAAQTALEREDPWVVAGTAVGGTILDDVVQRLQTSIRAFRLESEVYGLARPTREPFKPGIDEMLESDGPARLANDQQPGGEDAVLAVALKASIARCVDLLVRLDRLVPGPDVGRGANAL